MATPRRDSPNARKASQLRRKHRRFVYEDVALGVARNALRIRFRFLLEPDIVFTPETIIRPVNRSRLDRLGTDVLESLAFQLGLVEMVSYWKAACSPEIVVKAGMLNDEQLAWWKDLILHGMGEFFFVNRIDSTRPDFLKISVQKQAAQKARRHEAGGSEERNLVLVSGGKDSALTLQLLKEAGKNASCLLLNPPRAAERVAQQGGCQDLIRVSRTIDQRLLQLNDDGYLNGHTPFSALLAFLGVTCAALFDHGTVIVGNERSCDEGNVRFLGREVNHQYSKTFRFECRFRDYAEKYLARNINYFSLLRPIYEIQISRLFARYPRYFPSFRSCNRGQSADSWCKDCPKCLFVFSTLYPFLDHDEMMRIFGGDLFERKGSRFHARQLLGLDGPKAFECVGTKEEALVSLYLSLRKAEGRGVPLPYLLDYVKNEILPRYPSISRLAGSILSAWEDRHNLPPDYAELLQGKLKIHHEAG